MQFFLPGLGRGRASQLHLNRQALKGFRALQPPRARLPFPWEIAALLADHFLAHGQEEMGLATLLAFELYLRPGEVVKLRAVDLAKPVPRNANYKHFSIVEGRAADAAKYQDGLARSI